LKWLRNVLMRDFPGSGLFCQTKRSTDHIFECRSGREGAATFYEAVREGNVLSGYNSEVLQVELAFILSIGLPFIPTLTTSRRTFILHWRKDIINQDIFRMTRQYIFLSPIARGLGPILRKRPDPRFFRCDCDMSENINSLQFEKLKTYSILALRRVKLLSKLPLLR
jgi:hypothetical protein